MSVDFERHRGFNGKIGTCTYSQLENLSKISSGNENFLSDLDLPKTINVRALDTINLPNNRMKFSIHYIKLCRIIDSLLKEYENYDDEFRKTVIDYYIQSNCIKEMNHIGLGWYYDVKYIKETSTLYSVGYGEDSNWHEWLKDPHSEHNRLKEKGIQSVFRACKEHINRGGKIRLKSLSKCFGIDLFKYMQLDRNGIANLYIIKDAPINFIEYEGSKITLQEYLLSNFDFDAKKNPEFCFDFSYPRNKEKKNFDTWSKKFLSDGKFISEAELEDSRKALGMGDNNYDYFVLYLLKEKHTKGGDRAISSRVSPIADREVIASKSFWEINEYTEEATLKTVSEQCYHITFDETEYYYLIFSYFKAYYKNKSQEKIPFEERYSSVLEKENENIKNYIDELEKKQQLLNNDDAQHKDEDKESIQDMLNQNSHLIKFYYAYKDFLNNVDINETNLKVQFALSFIEWSTDEIPENWSLNNMYTVKENKEKNLKANLYKCLCKSAASV